MRAKPGESTKSGSDLIGVMLELIQRGKNCEISKSGDCKIQREDSVAPQTETIEGNCWKGNQDVRLMRWRKNSAQNSAPTGRV
jgi:hypothetical protein